MNGQIVRVVSIAVLYMFLWMEPGDGKSIVPVNQSIQSSGKQSEVPQTTTKRTYTCQCEDTPNPICANNGVTYKNPCRFECAKHKEERLRVVKEGDCGKYISKLQFWSFG